MDYDPYFIQNHWYGVCAWLRDWSGPLAALIIIGILLGALAWVLAASVPPDRTLCTESRAAAFNEWKAATPYATTGGLQESELFHLWIGTYKPGHISESSGLPFRGLEGCETRYDFWFKGDGGELLW